jgi:hypothetical protein
MGAEPARVPAIKSVKRGADSPASEPSSEASSVSPFLANPASILHVQRTYGNQAVGRLFAAYRGADSRGDSAILGGAASLGPLFVQRYDSYEHATEGDKAKGSQTVTINGVDLTSGEINAMGDFYATPDDLKKADAAELLRLRTLIRKQQADPNSVSEADWDKATGGRYNQLNLKNSAHFSPQNASLVPPQAGTVSGVDNKSMFKKYHVDAIVWASRSNQSTTPDTDKPKFRDYATTSGAFAEHFLMDAFSAGHLFNKDDVIGLIQTNLGALTKDQLSGVFAGVASQVFKTDSGFISKYKAKKYLLWWSLDSASRFQGLLEGIYDQPEGKAAVNSAIVKAAHDRLNTNDAGAGKIGVPVENDFGAWVLSGDRTLATSPDTQKWIDKALEQARANIQAVLTNSSQESDDVLVKKVLAYTPRPSAASTTMIHDLIKSVTDPKGGMIGAIGQVIHGDLPSLFDALEAKGYIKKA